MFYRPKVAGQLCHHPTGASHRADPPKKLGWLLQMWTPGKQSLEMSSPLKQRHVGPGLSSPSCLWAAAPRLIGPVLMLTPGRTSREADPGTGGLTALV